MSICNTIRMNTSVPFKVCQVSTLHKITSINTTDQMVSDLISEII